MFYRCAPATCSLMAFSECAPRGLSHFIRRLPRVFRVVGGVLLGVACVW